MQMLRLLPNHAELVRDLCQYDLVGFQTDDDVRSFYSCIELRLRSRAIDGRSRRGRRAAVRSAYPIGVDVEDIAARGGDAMGEEPCSA